MKSNFPRVEQDRYYTPFNPAVILLPHLAGIRTFDEPCAGGGDLIRSLKLLGLTCTHYGDLDTGQDALTDPALETAAGDAIITNPPYTKRVLHPLIERFSDIKQTWLLLELDFSTNAGTVQLMRRCTDIVLVGRVQWFPGTEHETRRNYAWYRFDRRNQSPPTFHLRDNALRRLKTPAKYAEFTQLTKEKASGR